jgi:hypothetical protein
VARRVILSANLQDAPRTVCAEARLRFEEIAVALQELPVDSPFWASVGVSQLCLIVRGWCFFYAIDDETLRVTEVRAK